MLRLVTLAAVLGVIGGLVGAFAFSEVSGQAEALALLATRVREQNLDANGLIRVHEQGTANVTGTVDVGNMPAVQDVNVVSMPTSQGRLIEVGTLPAPANGSVQFPVVDVRDCSQSSAMAETAQIPEGGAVEFTNLSVSTDGTNMFFTGFGGGVGSVASLGSWPFVQFGVRHSGDATDITAWVWCAP